MEVTLVCPDEWMDTVLQLGQLESVRC